MAGMNELEAVNLMLSNIGELPVSTLVGASGDAYVATAQTILAETNRAVLAQEWEFNVDTDYSITPDVNGEVIIASNVSRMDTSAGGIDVTVRQNKLYDKENHTFVFTVDELLVTVAWEFDFVETPQYMRQYIAVRAARIMAGRMQGDIVGEQLSADDERDAKATAKKGDKRTSGRSMLESPALARLNARRI